MSTKLCLFLENWHPTDGLVYLNLRMAATLLHGWDWFHASTQAATGWY